MRIYLDIDENTDAGRYFLACARIRDISTHGLLRRLADVVCADQLVSSVLDDSEQIKERRKGEHRYSGPPAP